MTRNTKSLWSSPGSSAYLEVLGKPQGAHVQCFSSDRQLHSEVWCSRALAQLHNEQKTCRYMWGQDLCGLLGHRPKACPRLRMSLVTARYLPRGMVQLTLGSLPGDQCHWKGVWAHPSEKDTLSYSQLSSLSQCCRREWARLFQGLLCIFPGCVLVFLTGKYTSSLD